MLLATTRIATITVVGIACFYYIVVSVMVGGEEEGDEMQQEEKGQRCWWKPSTGGQGYVLRSS